MSLAISNNGLALIKKFEGCRLAAYQDSIGVWTIGYGHTHGVSKGQTITQPQADAYLRSDCANAEKAVNNYIQQYNWNQNQFDALVSFTFNCGSGNLKTLLKNGQRTIDEISAKITAYNKAGGKILQGLVNRRAAEKELFDKPVAAAPVLPSSTIQSQSPAKLLGKINTKSGNLNIRSAPNLASAIVGTYKKGELVQLIDKTSTDWYRTDKGYVSAKYIMIL